MILVAQSAGEAAEQQDHAKDRADAFLQSHTDALSGVEAWRQVSHLLARRRYILPGFPHSPQGANEQQDAYEKEHHRSALHQTEPMLDALESLLKAIQPGREISPIDMQIGDFTFKTRKPHRVLCKRAFNPVEPRMYARELLSQVVEDAVVSHFPPEASHAR